MPMYLYECRLCGCKESDYRSVDERDDAPHCCEGAMIRRICAPAVISDMKPYKSMVDGSMITSRSQHRNHLREHGCIEVGNDPSILKGKQKIELTKESKIARKQAIIDRVNSIK